jgi:hypothetical protein
MISRRFDGASQSGGEAEDGLDAVIHHVERHWLILSISAWKYRKRESFDRLQRAAI